MKHKALKQETYKKIVAIFKLEGFEPHMTLAGFCYANGQSSNGQSIRKIKNRNKRRK